MTKLAVGEIATLGAHVTAADIAPMLERAEANVAAAKVVPDLGYIVVAATKPT